MKKTLVIGSCALDIIIDLDKIPVTSEDVHIHSQAFSLGGCAYNVQNILNSFQIPVLFCSPVGTGLYGNYVAAELKKQQIKPFVRIETKDNGCCYCFVEKNGERTFLSSHGVEYTFQKNWLSSIDFTDFDSVYICGLEIEEPTGVEIISFLQELAQPLTIYFAPGPRITQIDPDKLSALFELHPILHLNELEARSFTNTNDLQLAARQLYQRSKNPVIITAGEKGAYIYDNDTFQLVPGFAATVVDTIGAGDSHIGSMIACLKKGSSLYEAASYANLVAAKVVSKKGATLNSNEFQSLSI